MAMEGAVKGAVVMVAEVTVVVMEVVATEEVMGAGAGRW